MTEPPNTGSIEESLFRFFDLPRGIGFLEKVRGHQSWRGVAWIPPHSVTEMLVLLSGNRPLYLSLHELKIERRRSIVGLSLQTSDPAERIAA